MNSSIAFREATVEDADAIADQIVASRDKVRDYDGGPEGTADRFRGYIAGTHHPRFAKPPRKVWLALLDGRALDTSPATSRQSRASRLNCSRSL